MQTKQTKLNIGIYEDKAILSLREAPLSKINLCPFPLMMYFKGTQALYFVQY